MIKKVIIFLACWVLSAPLCAQSLRSLNDKNLILSDQVEDYSFIITGHIYGSMDSLYPTSTVLANIERFNEMNPLFMALLGDIVIEPLERDVKLLQSSFFSKLEFPVFNAIGNHDWFQNIQNYPLGNVYDATLIETYTLDAGEFYKKHFKVDNFFYSFQYATELFIFLNGESHNSFFSSEQWGFFLENITYFKNHESLRNLFVFSHRLLWARGNYPLDKIIPLSNSPSWNPKNALMMADVFLPILKTIQDKQVYLISGDVGAGSGRNLFYEKDPRSNLTYIATSVGDTDRDLIVKATIQSGSVSFVPVSLTQKELRPIESYGLDFWTGRDWNQYMTDVTIYNKLKREIVKMVKGKSIWAGFFFSFLTGTSLLVLIILKKKKL